MKTKTEYPLLPISSQGFQCLPPVTDDHALQQPRLCSGSHLHIGDSTTGNHYAPNSGIFGLEVSNSLMNCLSSSKLPKLKWPSPPKGGKSTAGSGCHRSRLKLIPVLTHPHQAPPLENVSPDGKWTQRTPTIWDSSPRQIYGAGRRFYLLLFKYLETILDLAFCPMKPKILGLLQKKSFLTTALEKKDTVSKYTHTRYIQFLSCNYTYSVSCHQS